MNGGNNQFNAKPAFAGAGFMPSEATQTGGDHSFSPAKALKNLHNTEFRGVEDKIKECRQKVIDLQSTMKQPRQPMSSVEEKKELTIRLEK
ncbi:uncharacterized protein LOC124898690 isoform X2 [Capsicum annuum]|uniref:uncharacterized protein LOC124898690 isoform X2 n=1 Tax=Capsicum annuum TaxID=4072 RepID=UPI001FB05BF6|nr:uncharacterized protein LOC124898690 isoform X2 [Capsicum annuum]